MQAVELLEQLLQASQRALKIATIIRQEKSLIQLLTEEKESIKKNETFFQDFKTLADVLIQETVRYFLKKKVPELGESIYGEESNKFTNSKGTSVCIEINEDPAQTRQIISQVLGGNDEAAGFLTDAVYCETQTLDRKSEGLETVDEVIPVQDCGIWIDPIDSTAQYIKGKSGSESADGFVSEGLQCVAILIGLFHKTTGQPVMGVTVHPFSRLDHSGTNWIPKTIWGINYKSTRVISPSLTIETSPRDRLKIVTSSSESQEIKETLAKKFSITHACGAGYKLLSTALGQTDAYVLSHRSIYRWDCCGLHAILLAVGGGLISYQHALQLARKSSTPVTESQLLDLQLSYIKSSGAILKRQQSFSPDCPESLPGIIAYRSLSSVQSVLECLKDL